MRERILEIIDQIKPGAYKDDGGEKLKDVLDSIEIITLVDMLEEEFNVVIKGICFQTDNFQNVDSLIEMVERSRE